MRYTTSACSANGRDARIPTPRVPKQRCTPCTKIRARPRPNNIDDSNWGVGTPSITFARVRPSMETVHPLCLNQADLVNHPLVHDVVSWSDGLLLASGVCGEKKRHRSRETDDERRPRQQQKRQQQAPASASHPMTTFQNVLLRCVYKYGIRQNRCRSMTKVAKAKFRSLCARPCTRFVSSIHDCVDAMVSLRELNIRRCVNESAVTNILHRMEADLEAPKDIGELLLIQTARQEVHRTTNRVKRSGGSATIRHQWAAYSTLFSAKRALRYQAAASELRLATATTVHQ